MARRPDEPSHAAGCRLACFTLALRRLVVLLVFVVLVAACLGTGVDARQRQLAELLVRGLLFLQCFLKQLNRVVHLELLGPSAQRAVARDLVVLDGLRAPYQPRIQDRALVGFADQLLGLFDEALERRALLAFRLLAEQLEDLLEALDLAFGLLDVLGKGGLQVLRGRLLRHLRQRLEDGLLGEVHVLQRFFKQLIQRAHGCLLGDPVGWHVSACELRSARPNWFLLQRWRAKFGRGAKSSPVALIPASPENLVQPPSLQDQAEHVVTLARDRQMSLATVESCTAGALVHLLAQAEGASEAVHGGFVVYTKENKISAVGVPIELPAKHTGVSAEVALAMAIGGLARCPASLVASITGAAGPEAYEDGNPVGLVFVAVAARDGRQRVEKHELGEQSKDDICQAAMRAALRLLDELLTAHVPGSHRAAD
jgi:nicotinamide-nucleotide amidase